MFTKEQKSSNYLSVPPVVIHWFRQDLRIHDNPALLRALEIAQKETWIMRPIFILDTELIATYRVGPNRWRFLFDALNDLNLNLSKLGTRLFVLKGQIYTTFELLIKEWNVNTITYEIATDPYGKIRDQTVEGIAKQLNVNIAGFYSHTLYDPSILIQLNGGSAPKTYSKFYATMMRAGKPLKSLKAPDISTAFHGDPLLSSDGYDIPLLESLKIDLSQLGPHLFPGGETEALRRLENVISDVRFVRNFSKPETSPTSIEPSTTVLSPYLKFGCLSSRYFYECLEKVKGVRTKPPLSLLGQLIWREFYYTIGFDTPNFTRSNGNPLCKQIDWDDNEEWFLRWKEGRTGFPFIDAIMTQLKHEGWIHHLARHAVACFLTRGDLYLHWEKGQEVFEEWLIDADIYLNAGNWMWMSSSAFFYQYYRIYSPIKFGQKSDPKGVYIRKYIPILKQYPDEYIYQPWMAPKSVQKQCGCIIGKDYPEPMVEHQTMVGRNIARLNQFFHNTKSKKGNDEDESGNLVKTKKQKNDHKGPLITSFFPTEKPK